MDSRVTWDTSTDLDSHGSVTGSAHSPFESINPLTRHKTVPRPRRSGRCEVVTISGGAGLGKSDLLQRVHPAIRRLGYVGIAQLDRARRIPFEPFAKILASLLRQIFSERDVSTDYHDNIRAFLRPVWPTLHQILELPEALLSYGHRDQSRSAQFSVAQHILRENNRGEPCKRSHLAHSQIAVEQFLSQVTNKNMRLIETYLEILRCLCVHKLICVCLDDVQYADDETLDLIINIIKARVPCMLVLTARKEEIQSAEISKIFSSELSNIVKIALEPLSESEILEYVATTMHQAPSPSLMPLAAVIQEKSRGNPFYIRMMLETCYHKNCIWYSWRDFSWEFDLDRIFTEFVSPNYGECLGTEFLVKRLQEFPQEARAILVWASFLGSPFSFSLIQTLLKGEFGFPGKKSCPESSRKISGFTNSVEDIVGGLQYLVQSYILLPGETDDEFRYVLFSDILPHRLSCFFFLFFF